MTYGSVYEITNPLTRVAKQHMVTWFTGSSYLPSEWTFRNVAGTGSQGTSDLIDGGFQIKSATGSGQQSKIDCDNIRQYSNTGSSVTWIHKPAFKDSGVIWFSGFGYEKTHNEWSQINNQAICFADADNSVFDLRTEDSSSNTDVASNSPVSVGFHAENIELKPSSCDMSIDGVLEAVATTNLPTTKLQPYFSSANRTSTANSWHYVLMCEAFNT